MAMVLLALTSGVAPVAAGQIEEKRGEAAAIASRLEAQARGIVALDKEHRKARDELASADAAVARAEADMAMAGRRQDEARRLLSAHAQVAYVGGGTVSFLAQMARSTVTDAGARKTYLRVVAGEDRQAVGRLQVAREDLEVRRRSLAQARKTAVQQTNAAVADLTELEKASEGQRALLTRARGELSQLVAAEQDRRDGEAARAAARQAAVMTTTTAAAAPTPRAGVPTTAPPTTSPSPTPTAAPAPAPASSSSVDETFACIRQLESGNNYSSPGGGAYQFLDSTWRSLGYTGTASDASPAVQDEAARRLLARDGWSQWSTAPLCGRP